MESLPVELIAAILDYLAIDLDHADRVARKRSLRDLSSAALVNATLNRLAEPLLYASIDLQNESTPVAMLAAVLHALFLRPRRQRYVQAVRMHDSQLDPSHHMPPYDDAIPATLLPYLSEVVAALPLPEDLRADFALCIQNRSTKYEPAEAMATVLLCVCPLLRRCHINWGDWDPHRSLLARVLTELLEGSPPSLPTSERPLRFLAHLSLQSSDSLPLDRHRALLRLPSLQSVSFGWVDAASDVPFTCTAQRLELLECLNAEAGDLACFFATFPMLRSLKVTVSHVPEYLCIDMDSCGHALRAHGRDLAELSIAIATDSRPDPCELVADIAAFGSAAGLASLRKLEVALPSFHEHQGHGCGAFSAEDMTRYQEGNLLPTQLTELRLVDSAPRQERIMDEPRFTMLAKFMMGRAHLSHWDPAEDGWVASMSEMDDAGVAYTLRRCRP